MPRFPSPRPDVVALLRACKDLPDEELHRLVLADWLEENADTDAEIALRDLIRLQLKFDRLSGHDDRRLPLTTEAERLLHRHRRDWLGTLDTNRVNWGLQHGLFVMTCHEEDLTHDELGRPGLAEGWGWVERLTVLCTRESDYHTMVHAPPLAEIGTLNLHRSPLRWRGAQALASAPTLRHLSGLILSRTEISHVGLEVILDSGLYQGLTRLELDGNNLGPTTPANLAAWTGLGNLYRLTLSDNPITDAGLRSLLASDNLGRLRELHLAGCVLGTEGIEALASSPLALRELDLSRNPHLGAGGLQLLLASEWIGSVERLRLGNTAIGDVGVSLLANCDRLTKLRDLDLSGVAAEREVIQELIFAPGLAGLTRLDLRQTRIGYEGYRRAQLKRRPGLAILY